VRFLEVAHKAQLDIRLALGLRLHQPTRTGHEHAYAALPTMPGPQASVLAAHSRLNGHAHSGLAAHSHGLATHRHFHEQDPGWLSFVLRSEAPQRIAALKEALLQAAQREPILRSKGFIRSAEAVGAVLVQGVRARIVISADRTRADVQRSELVFIGYHVSRSNVVQLLSSMTGTKWY
jgi:cobalamin biosynthesis protein CobW